MVQQVTRDKVLGSNLCHVDPMFERDRCAFGQTGAAQSHLKNNGVNVGDVFLFFGLFSDLERNEPHHRIFGHMRVEDLVHLGPNPTLKSQPEGFPIQHPHTIGTWNINNHLYVGEGYFSKRASDRLRLSKYGQSVSVWNVPAWLRKAGLTYHAKERRWTGGDTLTVVGRGQEFVTDITGNKQAMSWLQNTIDEIRN